MSEIDDKLKNIIELFNKALQSKEVKEVYLKGTEVQKQLRISKAHLHDLRVEGKIPYTNAFGVFLYPQSQIQKIIESSLKNKQK